MKKKLLATLLTAAMTLSLFAGCGGAAAESAPATENKEEAQTPAAAEPAEAEPAAEADGTLTIGFSQYAAYNNWRVTNTDDINRALNNQGWKVIFADANDDTAQQISDIEDMIAQQPDYLVIAPREQEGYEQASRLFFMTVLLMAHTMFLSRVITSLKVRMQVRQLLIHAAIQTKSILLS